MDKLKLAQILLSVAGISTGQLLLKMAAINLHNPKSIGICIGSYCISWYLVAGIALLGVSTLLWIWVLRSIPLSVAYPFMAFAFVIVPLLSFFLLGEPLGWKNVFGSLLIIAGVVIISA